MSSFFYCKRVVFVAVSLYISMEGPTFFSLDLLSYSRNFCLQGQQEILFLVIVVIPLQPKIRIMTAGAAVTVLCRVKEPGGTLAAITPV